MNSVATAHYTMHVVRYVKYAALLGSYNVIKDTLVFYTVGFRSGFQAFPIPPISLYDVIMYSYKMNTIVCYPVADPLT